MSETQGSGRSPLILQFLAASVDQAPEGILAFDGECRYVLWNRRMEEITGKERAEVLGRCAFEVFPFLKEIGEDKLFEAALQGETAQSESRPYSVAERSGYFDGHYSPIRDEEGKIVGGVAHIRECSDRMRVNEAFRHETEMLDTLVRSAETVSAELDLQKIVQSATDAATQLSGAEFGAFFYNVLNERGESYMLYTISGVPREAFSSFPMPRNTEVFAPTFNGDGIVRSGDIRKDPRYGKNAPRQGMPEGHLPVRSYLAVPVKSRSGDEVFGGLFFGHSEPDKFTETSERLTYAIARQAAVAIENARLYESERRARAAAEKSEAQVSSVWSRMTDAFMAFDRDWHFQYVNDRGADFAQKPRAELLGKSLWEIAPEVVGTKFESELRRAADRQQPRHFDFQLPSRNAWFECHAYPSADGVSLYARDITVEKHAKEEIRKVEDRLKLITTTTDVGTWYCDLPFDVLEWSTKTKEHFWLPADAVVTLDTFYQQIHPEDRERTRDAISKSIAKGGAYDIDYRTVSRGGDIKWIRAIGRAFYDGDRKPIRFDGITVDQTERRRAEEALRRSERLATAGRLAATVAHEVNNPLEAVTNLIFLCQHDPAATESIKGYLKTADDELRRMAHIVRQTLGFYRESSAPQVTDISALVQGLVDLYRPRYIDKQVQLRTELGQSIQANVVPGAIRQVVANLLSNALDACTAGAEVTVRIDQTKGGLRIVVADTGHGITAASRERLFEPFFTTKTDIGTGLGLWVSRGIVEKHGGKIRIDSSTDPRDHGTTFTVDLPQATLVETRASA
jgi:PAS domain S-box-containing protein